MCEAVLDLRCICLCQDSWRADSNFTEILEKIDYNMNVDTFLSIIHGIRHFRFISGSSGHTKGVCKSLIKEAHGLSLGELHISSYSIGSKCLVLKMNETIHFPAIDFLINGLIISALLEHLRIMCESIMRSTVWEAAPIPWYLEL